MKRKTVTATAMLALSGTFAGISQAAPKPALPVVTGAQQLSKVEKSDASGEGLINIGISINALNNVNLLNNILNFGSFNNINRSGK